VARGQRLVARQSGLLERVRERVMADVVQQRRKLQAQQAGGIEGRAPGGLLELRQRAAGQMVRTQSVLEARVGGARVDEKRVSQLAHVAQALNGGRIHDGERLGLEPDVVPQRVADDLERGHPRGPASRTAAGAASCSKFSRNRRATRSACRS